MSTALRSVGFIDLSLDWPGYNPDGVLTLQLSLPQARYPQPEQQIGFFDQLTEENKTNALAAVPSAIVATVAMANLSGGRSPVYPPDQSPVYPPDQQNPRCVRS